MNTLANIRAAGKSLAVLLTLVVISFALAHQTAEAQETEQKTKTERLLQTDLDPLAIDENGFTHLHWAALAGDGEALKRLIEIGVFNMNPAANAEGEMKSKGKLRAQLLGMKADGRSLRSESPLHLAAELNKGVAASILIANGADVNAKTHREDNVHVRDITPLHVAASRNAIEVAEILLENGAEVNAKTGWDGYTPLDFAIFAEHLDIQSLLRRNGGKRENEL